MVFKRKLLSSSVALAIAGYAAPLMAEEEMGAQNATMEEVVVKGIRGSLQRSMDIKRDASGVVDAISAEEMGKFPDANLAESLQRITGVSISRSRGEGSQVTVRGFGPEYNLVTLNGRQMPTHNGASRSFDFGDLASEGVAGVQVYKTGRADIPTGGVGSTINISMPEPLKTDSTASISAKMVQDTSTRTGDDITPEFSGIYIGKFADDTVGIAITASNQNRNNGVNAASTGGWFTRTGDDASIVVNDASQVPIGHNLRASFTPSHNRWLTILLSSNPSEPMVRSFCSGRPRMTSSQRLITFTPTSRWSALTATCLLGSQTPMPCHKPANGIIPAFITPLRSTAKLLTTLTLRWARAKMGGKTPMTLIGLNIEWIVD